MALTQEEIIHTLLAARTQISASAWAVVCDAQAAEDIFQNIAVKVLVGGLTFERKAQVVSWAQVVARHEAITWLRKWKGRVTTLDDQVLSLLEYGLACRCPAKEGERVEALRQCLARLPERSRRLLEMRYFEEHSCTSVSQALGLTLDAVYQRLSRLHHALRQCIEQRLASAAPETAPETA